MLKYIPKELAKQMVSHVKEFHREKLGTQLISNVNSRAADGQEGSSSNWYSDTSANEDNSFRNHSR